jgi:hypothetical protein
LHNLLKASWAVALSAAPERETYTLLLAGLGLLDGLNLAHKRE